MKTSALEALIIGISIFIFVMAVTVSMSLMLNVLEATEVTSEYTSAANNNSLYETFKENDERIYTIEDVLMYKDKQNQTENKYILQVQESETEVVDISEFNIDILSMKDNKYKAIFKEIADQNIILFELI